jgi:esterase/lipase
MIKIFSDIVEFYAVYDTNKKKSIQPQFSNKIKNPCGVNIDNYETQSKDNILKSTKIHRENVYSKKNIILIHGWKQSSFNKLNNIMLDYINEKKYNLYYFTMRHHMDRKCDSQLFSGEYFISSNINRTVESINNTVSDLIRLIHYIRNNTNGEIILIGLSLGGLITNLVNTYEKDINKIISIFYPDNISYIVYNAPITTYIKDDLEINNITENMLYEAWKNLVPSNRKPLNNNILLLSGKYDQFISILDSNILWEKWNKPKRIVYNCGHSGIVLLKNKIKKDIINFIEGTS